MKDVNTLVNEYRKMDWQQRKGAIATVVNVHGSSYRSPGARMLILDDGKWVGSISGGCLEGDALRKARQVMVEKKSMTVTYDTREESNQKLGIGLGCNGVIDVLIQPVEEAIDTLAAVVHAQQPLVLATVFAGTASGAMLLQDTHGKILRSTLPESIQREVHADLWLMLESKRSQTKNYESPAGVQAVFLELVQPAPHVILFGGGFDARPVSHLAKSLGWRVDVTDECVAHIAPVFFPSADKLSLCQREFVDREFDITPYTACVLMSHNYEYDRDVLQKVINSPAPYIGILGPRKRFDKMVAELAQRNVTLTAEQLDRIHSPIGLDIGAEAPDEIALAIIAEIQSKFTHRSGGFLKHHPGPIHTRQAGSDQVLKQAYLGNTAAQKSV
ncbi:MAG: XdhC family protein [Cyclobacteriaceae bacterium]|jgi:xanthine/CO dehydrogenase XdhC/CoxF family maturation factor|nr:XdhC family protein [Cyclobacteriaceae bacterium]